MHEHLPRRSGDALPLPGKRRRLKHGAEAHAKIPLGMQTIRETHFGQRPIPHRGYPSEDGTILAPKDLIGIGEDVVGVRAGH
jgi:hypothetical protein